MDAAQNLPEKIEVKRGGMAQYFLYLPFIALLGAINAGFKIPAPYSYFILIAFAVIAVMSVNRLSALVFTKVLIQATKEGIWTSSLGLVPWPEVKDIRIERTSTFNSGNNTTSTSLDLLIETNDGREASYWGNFLNADPHQLCTVLNDFWKVYR